MVVYDPSSETAVVFPQGGLQDGEDVSPQSHPTTDGAVLCDKQRESPTQLIGPHTVTNTLIVQSSF